MSGLSPKISVVMAVYNGDPYIKQTIDCILKQTFTDFECIIVNDCSTDHTADIISSFEDPRIVLINNGTNMGSSRAGNIGIDNARAKYIARIDADDLISKDRFQKQYDYLEAEKDVAVLGSSFRIIGTNIVKHLITDPKEIAIKLFLGQNCIAHSSVMMRKEIFDTYGYKYNPENPVSQDYELWANISNKLKLANLPELLMDYRVHENQISTKRYGEQQMHAKRIVAEQLRLLMPGLSPQQIESHLVLTGFNSITSVTFEQLIHWLNTLKKINYDVGRFDIALFNSYIDHLLSSRKRDYFNNIYFLSKKYTPRLLIAYLKDKSSLHFYPDTRVFVKFMAKCLLFKGTI